MGTTFDKALELLSPGAALVANGQGTGVLLYPRTLPSCDWIIYASGVVATGTYTLNLQVSDVVGGTYTTIATVTWPPTVSSGVLAVGLSGRAAQFFDNDSRYMRVQYVIGGTTPGIILGSFLGKASGAPGLGVDVGDIYSFA